jgi:hypothetical protein
MLCQQLAFCHQLPLSAKHHRWGTNKHHCTHYINTLVRLGEAVGPAAVSNPVRVKCVGAATCLSQLLVARSSEPVSNAAPQGPGVG